MSINKNDYNFVGTEQEADKLKIDILTEASTVRNARKVVVSDPIVEKWSKIINNRNYGVIRENVRRKVTAITLNNTLNHAIANGLRIAVPKKTARPVLESRTSRFPLRGRKSLREDYSSSSAYDSAVTGNPADPVGINFNTSQPGYIAGTTATVMQLIRQTMPNNIAFDLVGVQAVTQPTSRIFAMMAKYVGQGNRPTWKSAFQDEADTSFSGTHRNLYGVEGQHGAFGGFDADIAAQAWDTPATGTVVGTAVDTGPTGDWNGDGEIDYFLKEGFGVTVENKSTDANGKVNRQPQEVNVLNQIGVGMSTYQAENLGTAGKPYNEMTFSIESLEVSVVARGIKAQYTEELKHDLKQVHGLDAESELTNILSTEINAELSREVVRTTYAVAKLGCRETQVPGVFDLDVDARGRWSVEAYKGIMFQIEKECNQIAKETRRGKGNFVLTSSNVAAALTMAGLLDYGQSRLSDNLNVDDTASVFCGKLNGRVDVYIDPYFVPTLNSENTNFMLVGYKGSTVYDSGLFYCPYVPLTLMQTKDPSSGQNAIMFKTRYGMQTNPFACGQDKVVKSIEETWNRNCYYRKAAIRGI